MELVKNLMELVRAYTLNMTIASCFIIFSYAYYSEKFTWINFILLVIALCLVQMGANLFDCYIDIKSKLKEGYAYDEMEFSTERKARLIRNGTFSLRQVEIILAVIFAIAILIGLYFAIATSWKVLIFALIGGLLVLFYPISSRYYLAEVVVGLIFGPLMIMGGYCALTGDFNSNLLFMSSAICFSTIILLHTHNIMDWEFDFRENKNTLAILSGNKQNAVNALRLLIILCYTIIVCGVISSSFNPCTLFVFLTLPIAVKLVDSMYDYINVKDVEFKPRWYWGFFENWKEIQQRNLAFFMFRFYLARNFAFFFALFAMIGAMS